jgi:uncharacterized membrane protein (DUF4010 family)
MFVMMELPFVLEKVGIALGLGLLVGLQRERARSPMAGIRTFALLTVLGTVCALLGVWVIGFGIVAVAALMVVANVGKFRAAEPDLGLTTEIAALLMFGVGAYLVVGHTEVAIAIGGGVALLLHWKAAMHAFVIRLGEADLTAIMQFVLITLVILPILPNQDYGPLDYDVLNPYEIWLMVVLIVGIGLGGYVAYKLFGSRAGAVLSGLLGGLISSTATTVSYARQSSADPGRVHLAALVILLASAVSVVRVLFEIAVVAPGAFADLAPPLALVLAVLILLSAGMYGFRPETDPGLPPQSNPAELRSALIFGSLYAVVILLVAVVKDYFGAAGLYVVAVISGLTDMDAITLSTSRLVEQQRLESALGGRVILLALLSNLVFKGSVVALLGHRLLTKWIAILYGIALACGLLLLLLW